MKRLTAIVAAIVLVAAAALVVVHLVGAGHSGKATTFTGADVPPLVGQSRRLGDLPPDRRLSVQVLLATPVNLRPAEDFLRGRKLAVTDLPQVGLVLVTGTVRALNATFGVRLDNWQYPPTGEIFYANDRPATLPFRIAGIFGLDNAVRLKPLSSGPCNSSLAHLQVCTAGRSAAQLRAAYNADIPGIDGAGQRVAVYAQGGFSMDNIKAFDQDMGLPDPQINVHSFSGPLMLPPSHDPYSPPVPGAGPSNPPSGDGSESEAELDIEAVHAMAPRAVIDVYQMAPDGPDAGVGIFLLAAAWFHEHVASISWGTCETDLGVNNAARYADLTNRIVTGFQMSIFAGSGDTGKFCQSSANGEQNQLGVNYPASAPSVTAVGGTHLDLKQNGTLNSEQAWDTPNRYQGTTNKHQASGGGESLFPRPSWQTGAGASAGMRRMVPDVAADADLSSGLRVYQLGRVEVGGGTSLAAPLWGGVAALYDQYAANNHAPPLGLANPLLYRIASQNDRPLLDVTTDQNGGPDLAGHAGQGWDPATGLGTPNAQVLIQDGVGRPPLDIRKVDWSQFTLPAGTCGSTGPVQLHDAEATVTPPGGYRGFPTVKAIFYNDLPGGPGPTYGDLAGDGRIQAALDIGCDTGGGTAGNDLGDTLFVYSVTPENQVLLLGTLPSTNRDALGCQVTGSLDNVKVVLGAVTADEHYHKAGDALANATGVEHHVWPWTANGGFAPPPQPAPTCQPGPPTQTTQPSQPSPGPVQGGGANCDGISVFDYEQGDQCSNIGGLLNANGVQLTVGDLASGTSGDGRPELCARVTGTNTTTTESLLTTLGFYLETVGSGPGVPLDKNGVTVNLQNPIGGTLNKPAYLVAGASGSGTVCFAAVPIAPGQQVLIIYTPAAQGRSIWVK